MAKDAQLDEWIFMPEFANQKSDQTNNQHESRPADPGRAEPIVFLSLVEDDLQATQPYGQQPQANPVQFSRLRLAHIVRILDITRNHEDGEDTDRDVDIKSPAPGIRVGEP